MSNELIKIGDDDDILVLKAATSLVDISSMKLRGSPDDYGDQFSVRTIIDIMTRRAEDLRFIVRSATFPTQLYHLANTRNVVAAVQVGGCVLALKGNKSTNGAICLSEEIFLNLRAEGSPNLIRMKRGGGFASGDMKLWFLMEMMRVLDMEKHSAKGHRILVQSIYCYIFDVIVGLRGLHDRGICHRDIKGGNTCLDFDSEIYKIGDLGSAAFMGPTEDKSTSAGTKGWSQPLRVVPIWVQNMMDANRKYTTNPKDERKIAKHLAKFAKINYTRNIDYQGLGISAFHFLNVGPKSKVIENIENDRPPLENVLDEWQLMVLQEANPLGHTLLMLIVELLRGDASSEAAAREFIKDGKNPAFVEAHHNYTKDVKEEEYYNSVHTQVKLDDMTAEYEFDLLQIEMKLEIEATEFANSLYTGIILEAEEYKAALGRLSEAESIILYKVAGNCKEIQRSRPYHKQYLNGTHGPCLMLLLEKAERFRLVPLCRKMMRSLGVTQDRAFVLKYLGAEPDKMPKSLSDLLAALPSDVRKDFDAVLEVARELENQVQMGNRARELRIAEIKDGLVHLREKAAFAPATEAPATEAPAPHESNHDNKKKKKKKEPSRKTDLSHPNESERLSTSSGTPSPDTPSPDTHNEAGGGRDAAAAEYDSKPPGTTEKPPKEKAKAPRTEDNMKHNAPKKSRHESAPKDDLDVDDVEYSLL